MEGVIITTDRCVNRCVMRNIWKYPTKIEKEFNPEILKKLPHRTGLYSSNIMDISPKYWIMAGDYYGRGGCWMPQTRRKNK